MRPTLALKTTSLLCVAIVLALITVQGTLAAWNATVVSNRQTVAAADFSVTVRTDSGISERLAGPGNVVAIPGASGLLPGASRTIAITLTNATDAGSGTFRIKVSAGAPNVSGDLAQYLTASIGKATGTDCSNASAGTSIELDQEETGLLCLTITLAKNAPAKLGGTSASVAVALNVEQLS